MKRLGWSLSLLGLLVGVSASPGADSTAKRSPAAAPADRPNILFLMADDWSWPHASSLGDRTVKTPTFDRVAREGVLFAHAHVAASSCTPSRLAIAAGQWHWRLHDGANLGGSLTPDVPVYPDLLRAAGYKIGFSGKGAEPSPYQFTHRDPFGPRFPSFGAFFAARRPGEPFCFWFGSGDPHRPYIWQEGIKHGMQLSEVQVPACLPDNATTRTDLCDYYYRVQRYDADAAKIIAALEQAGELEHTIVVMSGDNGLPFPRCKGTLYDTGTHVPLAIRWGARVKGGRTIEDLVSLCDLASTFLEAAGVKPAAQMTGKSLLPMLTADRSGPLDPTRKYVLAGMERHVFAYPCRSLRTSNYLYILNFEPGQWPTGEGPSRGPPPDFTSGQWTTDAAQFSFNFDPSPTKQFLLDHRTERAVQPFFARACARRPEEELYDLKRDPQELHNIAQEAAYRRTAAELRSLLESKLRASEDPRLAAHGYQARTTAGWTVFVSERLLGEEPEATAKALGLLSVHLEQIVRVVPGPAVAYLRTVPLWISPEYPGVRAKAEYHPNVNWLREHGRDPALAKCVEFTNVRIFGQETERMPVFVLHELAHAYHDQVFGFDHPAIEAAYRRALQSKTYDKVEQRLGGKRPPITARAYAMTNVQEYFAETTEAFFGRNDFFPFTRQELKRHDPVGYEMLETMWQAHGE